jgi:hypothetical protein
VWGKNKTKKSKTSNLHQKGDIKAKKDKNFSARDDMIGWADRIIKKKETGSKSPGPGMSKGLILVILISTLTVLIALFALFAYTNKP